MKFLCILLTSVFLLPLALSARTPAVSQRKLPAELVRLASRAKSSRTWPELRRFAASRKTAEERALAYFVLGYREYESGDYAVAEKDLAGGSSADSPLADLSEYYSASAAYKGGHPERVAGILGTFNKRFPSSAKHYAAIELLAWGYLQTGETQKALQVLRSEPEVRERPALALLLARAYANNGQLQQAAQTYQDIYYAFPTKPEAQAAGDALDKLRGQPGVNLPPVSDEIATARVEKLYTTSHYSEALKGYEQLLSDRRNSTWAWRWNLGRAKCLIRLGRGADAIETLVNSVAPTPELDAERLATLVDAYAQTEDDAALARSINRLRSEHFKSHWHCVALLRAANYFMYKGEWDLAPLYYRTLRDAFPKTPQASVASWRLAWITYLTGQPDQARAFLLSHIKNYPDSPHLSAAIYFLGRLEEDNQPAKARALYELLRKRFLHDYYALEAARRLSVLRKDRVEETSSEKNGPDFSVSALASKIPAVDPPDFGTCLPATSGEDLVPFKTLDALHLDDLAQQELQGRLARHPDSPDLVLALSQFEAKQGRTDRALYMTRKIAPDYHSQQFSELPREIWELLYPRAYTSVIRRYAVRNHLDPYLVMGLIRQESAFNPRATSFADARGLMQVVASTVTRSRLYQRTVGERLYGAAYNVRFGCAYLRELLKRYHGNMAEAVAAYNAGPSRVDQWLSQRSFRDQQEFVESIPYPGTRVYVKAVFADSGVYRQLVRGTAEFAECSSRTAQQARRRSTERLRRHSKRKARPLLANRNRSRAR
ncbi:MAG TPA: transglycosylase SLT domain-containing protein [Terriglobia bacterium]|nr:transglycosylase SLT domain-containing protein [Terriglobia bacterium]